MRIQPQDIEVPEDNPFEYDLLSRREAVETLTHLVDNIEGPCVLAVDAEWGFGKTTFLRMWAQHLRNEGFPVVEFNAWETDFSEDPFLTLSTELMESIESSGTKLPGKMIEKLRGASQEILRCVLPGAIRLFSSHVPVMGTGIGEGLASFAEERMSRHVDARKSIKKFREVFQATATELSEASKNHPLMVTIDELDRCRPSYAVELLEVAKHLFAVDHVVFILSVNRDQLAHSIRALYGNDFNAEGYLRRFFDLDFKLPEPSRDSFINAQLQATGISDYWSKIPENNFEEYVRSMLLMFFGASDLSLRTVGQAIHRLGLLYASLRSDQYHYALATTVALILRTLEPRLYDSFVRHEISDRDVANGVFHHPGLKPQRFKGRSAAIFEAVLILHTLKDKEIPDFPLSKPSGSPLLDRYNKRYLAIGELSKENDPEDPAKHAETIHAQLIIGQMLNSWSNVLHFKGFTQAVERIELLDIIFIKE